MTDVADEPARRRARRRLSWLGLAAILVPFMLAPALLDVLVFRVVGTNQFAELVSVRQLAIAQSLSLAIVVGAVSLMRWWPLVLRERRRVRQWVWVVPGTLLLVELMRIDYTRLILAGPAIAVGLLLGVLLIAASEELMFRGVVLTFLRDRYSENVAAIGSSIVFGLAHFPSGPLNMVSATLNGYLFYYARRVSGGLAVPIVVHALFDYALFSGATTADPSDSPTTGMVLFGVSFVLVVLLAVLHRFTEPSGVLGIRGDVDDERGSSLESPPASVPPAGST